MTATHTILVGLALSAAAVSTARAQVDLQATLAYGATAVGHNPALLPDRDLTIQLVNFHTATAFNFVPGDLGTSDDGALRLRRANVRATLPAVATGLAQADAATVLVNVRRDWGQWGFGHAFRVDASARATPELVELIAFGNADLLGERLPLEGEGSIATWHEASAHLGLRLSPKLVVGVRAKLLLGGTQLGVVEGARLGATFDPQSYAVSYDADVAVRATGYRVDLDSLSFRGPKNFAGVGAGTGFAATLGIVYRPTQRLEIAVAADDLGVIRWKGGSTYAASGAGVYRGLEGNVFAEGYRFSVDAVVDDFEERIGIDETAGAYRTTLRYHLSAHARMRLSERLDVAVSAAAREGFGELDGGALASVDYQLSPTWRLGAGAGVANGQLALAARATARLGAVEVYAASNDLVGLLSPYGSRNTHGRIGVALAFGRRQVRAGGLGWYDTDAVDRGRVTPDNML